ncbi:MAG: proprotein convertase P-domain-containing protein, partial [Planctomycetes bacterium]|nr:proprotein convertase P-domain-containing protein [Planctomycetota bacterium]
MTQVVVKSWCVVVLSMTTVLGAQGEPWEALTSDRSSAVAAGPGLPTGALQGPAFLPSGDPLGICLDSGGALFGVPTLYVVDLFAGFATLLDATDLSLLGTIPTPSGASITTGIATDGTQLFWAADGTLVSTDMDGSGPVTLGPLALPMGGVAGDITLDDLGRIWAIDVVNDGISAHDASTGAALGPMFVQPSAPGAFGNGIAFRADCARLEVLHGAAASGQVTRVSVVSTDGVLLDSLDIAGLGPFVNGVAATASSPTFGVPSLFLVENGSGAVFEIAALDPCPALPSDCHALASTSLTLPFSGFPTESTTLFPGSPISDVIGTTASTAFLSGSTLPVRTVRATVAIDHTWIGDLDVTLRHVSSATVVQLHDSAGLASDDILATFDDRGRLYGAPFDAGDTMQPSGGVFTDPGAGLLADFAGLSAAGPWRLSVIDNFPGENGTLQSWTAEVSTALAIPDGDPLGATLTLDPTTIAGIGDLDLVIGIDHPAPHELEIALVSPTGIVVTLEAPGAPTALLGNARFDDAGGGFNDGFGTAVPAGPGLLADFDGEPLAGTWALRVID